MNIFIVWNRTTTEAYLKTCNSIINPYFTTRAVFPKKPGLSSRMSLKISTFLTQFLVSLKEMEKLRGPWTGIREERYRERAHTCQASKSLNHWYLITREEEEGSCSSIHSTKYELCWNLEMC